MYSCILQVTGLIAEDTSLFKSALMPAKFNFRTVSGESYAVSLFTFTMTSKLGCM